MKTYRNTLLVLLLSLGVTTSGLSKNVKKEEINTDLESIQVIAFKERKNILNQNRAFSAYDVFILSGDDLNRLFIVNIKKRDYQKVFKEIKKQYPTAFKATRKMKKMFQKKASKSIVAEDIFISDLPAVDERKKRIKKESSMVEKRDAKKEFSIQKNRPHNYHDKAGLNSQTILQTRKKFF